MEEVWKDIEGYDGDYQISNKGNIKSFKRIKDGKLLKATVGNTGYCTVKLSNKDKERKTFRVHRLVALHFLELVEGKDNVNHKNGDKTDNDVNNLEWCTYKENNIHARKTGLNKANGEKHYCAKLTEENVKYIRENYIKGSRTFGQGALSRKFGVSQSQIFNVVHNITWKKKNKKQ